uniref:Secreted protein n=1 Tax=Myripristis murdjan TaxID=586833 RepID=A0A667WJ60_9TELE
MTLPFTLPLSRLLALSLLTWLSAMSARSSASSSSCCTFLHLDRLKFLELLLATLHGQVLCLIQAVSLHLLLDSQGVVPAPDLRVQSALHGVNHPLAVPFDLLHLLILLCQLPVNLTLDLVELQLDTQNLGLFVFQSSLVT